MARTDTRYRTAYNRLLDYCQTLSVGDPVPAEAELCALAQVSRTVVRRVQRGLQDQGILHWQGRDKRILRSPTPADRIAQSDPRTSPDDLEHRFLDWVLRFDIPADTPLSVADLSRRFTVSPHELKEFLAGLSRFGLVSRRRQGGWALRGFTRDFAIELSDFRTVLELDAVRQVVAAPVGHPVWAGLALLRDQHLDLRARVEADHADFSQLDEAFHRTVNSVVSNRFVAEFQKVISLIFHYHYLWDKADQQSRNAAAIDEHLAILDALLDRDAEAALAAARRHLATSKTTLLASLKHNLLS